MMIVMIIYDQDDNRDALHEEGKMINMQSLCVFTILLKLPPFLGGPVRKIDTDQATA